MFSLIILLWVLIKLNAPIWTYVLLGVAAFINVLSFGINISEKCK